MEQSTEAGLRGARYFSANPEQREIAQHLHDLVADLPLVCPHGHVDPQIFADESYRFGTPTELLLIPDHYVFRMLHSQGIPLEELGVPRVDGGPVEQDHRAIWQTFAENFHLFRGTPTGLWLRDELETVFGVAEKLHGDTAQAIYDQIAERLASPEFEPRVLFDQFNIEVLCTTDAATDTLDAHLAIRESEWHGRVIPTFRPDALFAIDTPGWLAEIDKLRLVSGIDVTDYASFIEAVESRRAAFRNAGARATDHGVFEPFTVSLAEQEAEAILQRALQNAATPGDARRFTAHMLVESARMSVEDGLTMQIHSGSFRNHNPTIYQRFGADKGADVPVRTEYTCNLKTLLDRFGSDPRLSLVLFTLDETAYARELAPLAGHYPAVKLGPPWWFHDSPNGMKRYFEQVMETAGIYNTVGFNDDTRAFPSIPARHDLWRRASADWIAGLMVRGLIDLEDAEDMAGEMAYHLAKEAYKL